MRGGLLSSVYFLSCQLLTTAPRLEISTRYSSFSITTVRSCVSLFALTGVAGAAPAIDEDPGAAFPDAFLDGAAAPCTSGFPPSAAVGADAEIPGLELCGEFAGGLGAKNFAHTKITAMDNNDAARMRNSGVNLSFSCVVTNVPLCGYLSVLPATLPEPGRIQIAAIVADSAAAV